MDPQHTEILRNVHEKHLAGGAARMERFMKFIKDEAELNK